MPTEKDNKVTLVIVTYNAEAFIGRCLDALLLQTLQPEQVVVADNNSSDNTLTYIKNNYPWVKILAFKDNLGFAKANNLAIQQSKHTTWIALLNPDAFPEPQWLEILVTATQKHPEVSFFGSRLINAENPQLLDGEGDIYHVSGAAWRHLHGIAESKLSTKNTEIFSPCAAAALYQRQAFFSIGGFDEQFFCYLEDIDLGFRLRLNGHKALQVSSARVLHMGSASTGILSDFTLYHIQRNLLWVYFKNMPLFLLLRYLPQHILLNLAGFIALALRGKAKTVLRAKYHALKGLPSILKKRKKIQQQRTIDDKKLLAIMAKGLFKPYRRDKDL